MNIIDYQLLFFPDNRLLHTLIFSDNLLRVKLNSHTAHLRSQTKNQVHSQPSPSSLCMCFVNNRIASALLCEVSELRKHIYIARALYYAHPPSLTNLPMHSLSFEFGQTDSWLVQESHLLLLKSLCFHRCSCMLHLRCTYVQNESEGTNDISLHPTWHSLTHPLLSLHFSEDPHFAQLSSHPHPYPHPSTNPNEGGTQHPSAPTVSPLEANKP